jgi:hypothetical protein
MFCVILKMNSNYFPVEYVHVKQRSVMQPLLFKFIQIKPVDLANPKFSS